MSTSAISVCGTAGQSDVQDYDAIVEVMNRCNEGVRTGSSAMMKTAFHEAAARRGPLALGLVLLLVAGFAGPGYAATVPFTYEVSAEASIFGVPTPDALSVPTTMNGSGFFDPFGTATYSEEGTVTFRILPSGAFVPASVMNNFIASFNDGADTFTGTDSVIFGPPNAMGLPTFSSTLTITDGTGMFSGATGLATATGTAIRPGPPGPGQVTVLSFTGGSGEITAPGLAPIPEPATILLLGAGLAAMGIIRKTRRGQY